MFDVSTLPIFNSTVGPKRHRRIGEEVQPRPMARNYETTDPRTIADKLVDAGFMVSAARSLYGSAGGLYNPRRASKWRVGLEVIYPTLPIHEHSIAESEHNLEGYADRARILLAHDGRTALRIALGAMRSACCNQFTGAEISIHHTDPATNDFTNDPARVLFDLRHYCGSTVHRIESLHNHPYHPILLHALRTAPRIQKTVHRALLHYPDGATFDTAWSLAQALSETRSPRAIRATRHLSFMSPASLMDPHSSHYGEDYLKVWSKN